MITTYNLMCTAKIGKAPHQARQPIIITLHNVCWAWHEPQTLGSGPTSRSAGLNLLFRPGIGSVGLNFASLVEKLTDVWRRHMRQHLLASLLTWPTERACHPTPMGFSSHLYPILPPFVTADAIFLPLNLYLNQEQHYTRGAMLGHRRTEGCFLA